MALLGGIPWARSTEGDPTCAVCFGSRPLGLRQSEDRDAVSGFCPMRRIKLPV
jgi:hypothetical protein